MLAPTRVFRPLHIPFGLLQINLLDLADLLCFGRALRFVFGGGVLEFLNDTILLFESPDEMGRLTPTGQPVVFAALDTCFDALANSRLMSVGK